MDEKALKAQARLTVIEYMLQRLYMIVYGAHHITCDEIKDAHAKVLKQIGSETFPTDDPARSMLVAGELEDAMRRFLETLDEMLIEMGMLKK